MKLLFAVLTALCTLVLATPVQEQGPPYSSRKPYKTADAQHIKKQQDILRLYKYINQPNYYKDLLEVAKSYSIKDNINNYSNLQAVKQLLHYYNNSILPRGEIFSVFYNEHLQQAIALYRVLYSAKDYDTFYKTAVWARTYINEGLYLYSVSVAILHRPDTYGIVLPPIYEVYPFYFFNAEVIHQAQWYKQLHGVPQQQQGNYSGYTIYANYSGYYLNLHPEQSLAYYTEDVGINAYYYYYNLYRPFWLTHEDGFINSYQRGEEFYYFYQQILARYYLERLSNYKGEIGGYDYEGALETGYTSSLCYPNGLSFPQRPNWAEFGKNYYNYGQSYSFRTIYGYSYTLVQDYERRIRDAIDSGYIITQEGQKLSLYEPHGFNLLGNIIESNPESPNARYYGYLQIFARHLIGYAHLPLHKYKVAPSALEHFETSLRDPAFYQLYKRLIIYLQKYKYNLPTYTYDELVFPGVKIEDVQIDPLITYFENVYADISSAVYVNEKEYEGDNVHIRVGQQRLNHKPFNYTIHTVSDKPVDTVVRVYIGPKHDEYGRHIDINENRVNFVELDRFKYNLQTGKNIIERNSHQIYAGDYAGHEQLHHSIQNGAGPQEVYGSEVLYLYPNRYALPKGHPGGQTYQIYVIISPYKPAIQGKVDSQQSNYYHPVVGLGVQSIDSYPLGYPLDRPIDQHVFYVPNSYFKDIMIRLKTAEDINTLVQS